jgi:activator of 2-hydroxyglutaryl-CoA dehydratase
MKGALKDFRMTGKCAAGTGRTMELMAESLGVDVSEIGALSLSATSPLNLKQACSVLTAVKIKHQVLQEGDTANIAAGITRNVAQHVMRLVYKVDIEKDIAITGGIAKNVGFVKYLKEMMGMEFVELPADPQIIGAIGAAVFAADQLTNPD